MTLEHDPENLPKTFTPGLVWIDEEPKNTQRFFADREWRHDGGVLRIETYSGQMREYPVHRIRSIILHDTTTNPETGQQYLDSAEKIDIIRDKYADGGDDSDE